MNQPIFKSYQVNKFIIVYVRSDKYCVMNTAELCVYQEHGIEQV